MNKQKSSRRRTNRRQPTNAPSFVGIANNILDGQHGNQIHRGRCIAAGTISSSAGGTISSVLNMNPSGYTNWASFAALYDEFRIVGLKLTLISKQAFSVTAANGMGVIVFDNDDTTALTTINDGLEYDTRMIIPAVWANDRVFVKTFVRPNSGLSTNVPWIDVGTPASSLGSLKFLFTALSASTSYLDYSIELAIEFRGSR